MCLAPGKRIFKLAVTFGELFSSNPKITTMQKKNWISVGLIAIVLIASLLILNASTPKSKKSTPTCCKKVSKECPSGIKNGSQGETTLENLSNQFIALPVFLY